MVILLKEKKMSNKKKVYNKLKGLGFSTAATAGIMGNIAIETGGTYDYKQKQRGGGKGRGLFQMEVGNAVSEDYAKFLDASDKEDSLDSQLEYMHHSIYKDPKVVGHGNAKKLRNVFTGGTAEEVAELFMSKWEKPGIPHLEKRVEVAKTLSTGLEEDPIEEAIKTVKRPSYEVKSKDTLSSISRQTGTPLEELIKLNNIQNPDVIQSGTKLLYK